MLMQIGRTGSYSIRERSPSIRIAIDVSDSPKSRSGTEDVQSIYKRETEEISEYVRIIPKEILYGQYIGGVLSFISHVAKWLYRQPPMDSTYINERKLAEVKQAIVETCDMISSKSSEEITLRAWNALMDRHGDRNPAIWLDALKAFIVCFELIPKDTSQQLQRAGELSKSNYQTLLKSNASGRRSLLGANLQFSPTASSQAVRDVFVPVLEDLSPSRHSTLAALCALLQRDRRNQRSVAASFGPWLLLEKPIDTNAGSSSDAMTACADTLEILITLPEVLFGGFEMPAYDHEAASSNNNNNSNNGNFETEGNGGIKSIMRRGSSLRHMLRRFGSSGRELTQGGNGDESDGSSKQPSPTNNGSISVSALIDPQLISDLKDRPARSRQSLERLYGRAPAPPPPKSPSKEDVSTPSPVQRDTATSSTTTPPPIPRRSISPSTNSSNGRPSPLAQDAERKETTPTSIPTSPLFEQLSLPPALPVLSGGKDAPPAKPLTRPRDRVATSSPQSSVGSSTSTATTASGRKAPPIPKVAKKGAIVRRSTADGEQDVCGVCGRAIDMETKECVTCVAAAKAAPPPVKRTVSPTAPKQVAGDKTLPAPANPPPRSRTPPPIPQKNKSPSATTIAVQASARRRGASKEAI